MAKKPLQTLYESLRANNYDVPDNYGSFERTLTAPGTEGVRNRQTLYKALRDNNYDVPDTYESFSRTLFSPVKPTGGTAASGLSQLPADVEERRMRTRNKRETHPLNKSRARQRLQAQQQAIEAQQQQWEQDNKRFKEDIARREQRLPGGMERFEERAKEQLATGESAPMPLAPNDEVVRGDIVFNPSTGRMEQTYTTPEGGTFFDRNTAEFDHSLQNMPDDEIEMLERERELIGLGILRRGRELDEEYENQSWWDRFLAGLGTDPEMGPGPRERMAEEDEELQSLLTAWRKNRNALRILYDERNNDMNSFWHNFGTTVANGYTFTGGRAELHDAQAILNSSKRMDEIQRKMQAGEKLSNVENAALSLANNTAWDNAIQAMYGDDYGAWATAGGAAVQSLEMMPEFIAGMPVLKGMGTAAIKLLTRNAANGLGRFMLKGLGMTLGTMAGGAIMANTIQAERTFGKAANKAAGSWWFGDDGEFMLGHYDGDQFVSGGESLAAALFHAEQEAIPEAASEGAGEFLPGIGQVLSKIGLSRIAKPLATLSGKSWYKGYQGFLKAAGWHGVGGEALEEYVGTLDGLIMGDLEGVKRLADPRTHFDIWLSCATLGPLLNAPVIVGSSMRGVYSPVAYHKLKAAVTRQDKIASFRLTEDHWAPWRDRIDATPNEQMADLMVEVRDNQELAPQEKKAIFDYVKALQGYRGWNLGEYIFGKDAEEDGDGKSEQEQQQSQEYSNGYETVTPEERRAAKDRLDVARTRLGEHRFVAETLDGMSIEEVTDLLNLDTIEDEDRSVLQEYINARTAYDGMLARVNDDIDDEVAVANEAIEQRVAPENAGGDGMIHPAVLIGGREVFIISGNVATLVDNSIDVENSNSMIIVRDAEGNEDTISPDKIQSLGEVQDPAQQLQEVEQQIVDEQGQAAAAQIEGKLPFNVGDQYTINYQGEPHTYQVVQADENNVAVLVDGAQEPVVLTKQQLQQMADEERAASIAETAGAVDNGEGIMENEEPAAVEPEQPVEAPAVEETPAAPVVPEDNPTAAMPMDDQGEPAWDQVEPERGHQFLYQESGWPQAMADNFVQDRIDEAEKALKKAQEAGQKLIYNPKPTFSAQQQAVAENTAAQQAAQSALDYWKGVQSIQAQATAPVVETPAEQEPTEQAPVAEVEEPAAPAEPEAVEPVEETPAAPATPATEEAPQSEATPEQEAEEVEPEKTDIELLQEEFEDELSRDDIKVEVLPETFEESSAEMTVNVTVDGQATNIWFVVGEGNTVDEHWKRISEPFPEMSWQEVDDLAEEYNQVMGKTVCDANDEAKRINFKDIEEAIAFEKWMQERARLKMLEARFGYDFNTAPGNVSIIPNSVEEEDGVVRGRLRIDGKDSNIWVSADRQSGNLNVYAEFEPGKDAPEGLADEFNKYFSDEENIAHVTANGDIRFGNDDIDIYAAVSFFKWLDEMEEQAKSQQGLVADIQYSIESQGEVPKGEKPKAFKMGEVTSNDGNRNGYALGVYHDPSGTAVATDGYIMIVDSREYDEQHKGKVIAQSNIKKGSEIKEPIKKGEEVPVERYPNWKSVFPKKKDTESVKVDFNALCGWLAGVEKRMQEQWKQWKQEHPGEKMSFDNWRSRSAIQILMPDGKVQQFKFDNLYTFARAAASQGAKTLRYYPNQDNRAFSFDSKFGSGLVMPYNTEHYSYIDNPYRVENGLGVNLDSSLFTYDMSNGLTMPGKTAGNRVELNYESGKDAESRAYIEEVMEREGWDEEAKSEFRKILDDAADLVSRMAQGFTRLREWNNKKLTDEQGNYNPLWRVWDKAVGWIPNRSSFKKNGEYPYNIDLGALCTKREAFDAVVRYIKEQGWGQNLGPNQIEALKSLLREHGFLTACDICFNETKRARALDYGNAVAYYWNAVRQAAGIDDDLPVGTPRELTDEQVKILTALAASKNGKAFSKYIPKEVRRTYETYVNSKGQRKRREADKGLTPTMTAKIAKLFLQDPSLMGRFEGTTLLSTDSVDALVRQYPHTTIAEFIAGAWGSATPKPNEGFNIYDPLSWKQAYDKKRQRPAMDWFFNLGGFRAQSFSDYSPIFFYDYVQMFTDLAIRRLPIHIYTKVPALIKLFGGTGAKFNMSLVPEVVQGVDPEHLGLKPDGNGGWELAWHEDSFPVDEAFALRQDPRFRGNVGTIAVGISDAHIRMLLDDPRIDMVIPYHKSGMPKSVQIKTGLNNATDYTDDQKTKGKKKGLKDFSFNEALRRLGDPRKAADEYLAWCKQNKCTPKFPQFADHPNYYKVLEDFRCIDNEGNYSPQQPVQVSFFDDVEQRLSESLEDKTMQEGLDNAIRGNDAITEGIKKIMSKPRLDGKIRDMMLARLKQVLGKDNVASLKQEDFFDELSKVYTDQMGAERAQQQVEVLRTSGGIVYGFAVGDRIVLNENYFNAETPMHEFTHVWVKVARLANPQMWAEGKELLKQTKEWQDVMSDEFYRDIQGDEDAVASEVLARIVGQDAARQINEMFAPEDKPQERPGIYNKIKQWVSKFLDGVRSLFSDNAKGLTYDELVRMPMKALFDDAELERFQEALAKVNEEDVDLSSQGSVPTFYSNAERAVQNVKQNKATAEQWKAMLTKQGGIKAGEDKWMGLSTWLDEHKGETLTKDEVLQFVRDNAVQMEEVNYGDKTSEIKKGLDDFANEFDSIVAQKKEEGSENDVYDEAFADMVEKYGEDFDMAFMVSKTNFPESSAILVPVREYGGELSDAAKYFLGVDNQEDNLINKTRLDYTTPGLENKREIAFVVPNVEPYQEHDEIHFGPENQGRAVMWVRFGETTDTDGKRVLVIDEIQSNRHQDAREKGYKDKAKIQERQERIDAAKAAYNEAKQAYSDYWMSLPEEDRLHPTAEQKARGDELDQEVARTHGVWWNAENSIMDAIPAAPFEKNWHEVAMKRMLRLAAEEGFDKVAWTTGGQQARRYDLGQVIDKIVFKKETGAPFGEPDRIFYPMKCYKDGELVKEFSPAEENLEELVGRDIANEMKASGFDGENTIEKDLITGNVSGMQGFYDKMLPQFINKYGKRWGVKVGEVQLSTPGKETMHSVDVTPEMRRSVMAEGQPLFQIKSLGAPYQGSKGQIATRIVDALPSGRRFVDLFSGGGAVTHAAMLSGKYEGYRMNDINPAGQELFLAGMRGDYHDYQPRELTAEEFKAIKGTPEGLLLSYSGLGRNVDSDKESVARRLRRVQRLEELKPYADQVEPSNTDYREVQLQPGDVVYADIPYEGTNKTGYREGAKFDKQAFSDWALGQDVPIYVSEQSMPEGWVEVQSWDMKAMRGKTRGEKLFVQAKFAGDGGNATAHETDQTKSANFKRWFGDWENDPENASKVVDEEGEPLVMTHNTDQQFTIFDRGRIGSGQGQAYIGLGFNFSRGRNSTYGGNAMEVYLNARNPLQSDGHKLTASMVEQALRKIDEGQEDTTVAEFAGAFVPYGTPEYDRAVRKVARDFVRDYDDLSIYSSISVISSAKADTVIDAFKELGFDSTIERDSEGRIMNAVVFDPNQVKSATENNGDFDPNNDDIRFRDDDEVAERDREYREAVERGDMKRAQEMLMEEADRKLNEALQLPDDSGEMGFKYHRGPAPKKIRTMYAVLNVSPDGMRAAYAGNKTTTPIGVWLDAVPLKSYASDKNKNDDGQPSRYVPGDTGHNWKLIFSEETYAQMMKENPEITKSTKWLYERGGKHGTDVPNFSQMNVKDPANVGTPKEGALTSLPHNKLVFEIECGMDEDGDLTEYVKENGRFVKGKSQGLSWVGTNKFYFFKTNPNASGNWGIAGTFRIKRLVPYEEIVSETAKANERIKAENERIAKENEGKPKSKQKKLIKEIPLQRWVGDYKPEDSGISVADVDAMYQQGKKMKLMEPTYDDNGNLIPLSQRFNLNIDDARMREILEDGGTLRVYQKENGGLQNVDEVVVREDDGQWVFNRTIPGRFASREAALDALADYAFMEGMNVKGEPGSNTYVIRRMLPKGKKWRVEGVPGEFNTQFGAVDNARNFLQGHVFEVAEDGNSIEVLGAGSNLDNMLGTDTAAEQRPTQQDDTQAKPLTAKQRKAEERARKWRERTVANGRRRVEELGQRLGVKVTIVDDMSEQEREGMSKKKRRAKGWYDVRTGEVFINLGNHRTVSDIEATFLHEVVAHKGLRRLFGDEFDKFLHNVYYNVDASIREEINRLMAKNNWDYREATEEYLAKLAQQMNFERPDKYLKAWETVARLFRTLLQKMGLGNGMNLKDSDLQGILFESYHNMEKEGVAGLAEGVEFRDWMEREANRRVDNATNGTAPVAAESMFRDDEDDLEDEEDFYEEELEEEAENPEDLGEEVDDSEAGPSTFQEMMLGKMLQAANNAGAAQSARVSAMRSLGGALQQIRKAMSAQRNYDRATVNTIVRLAREVMASGYFNDLTRGEVKRLLAAAKNVNGSANVTEQANKVVDTLLRHHLRECENLLKKQLKVNGSKENSSGVEVQAGLDIEGQRMTTAMKQGMRMDQAGLSQRIAECLSRIGSSDPVVSSVAAQEYTGLMLAQQYHDTIKASRQEEQQMREEMRQAKAEFAARRDSLSPDELKRQRQDLKDYIAATEDAIRQNRMERADAYNQLSEMLGGGIASSMERAKQWREQQKERVGEIQHNANSDLEGVPADEHMRPTWKHRMANWAVVRFFMKPLATFDYMLRMMGQKSPNGEGYLWNRFMGGWVEANDKEFRNVKAAHKVLDEKVKEVFNRGTATAHPTTGEPLPQYKLKRWSDLFFIERKMKGMDVDFWDGDQIKTHTLTPGNLLYIYMVNKMSDGKMKLRKMGISEEDVEAIKNHLDPRLIELADWLQDEFLVQKRTEYNAVHERMFGAPMAAIENYFPLKINSRSRSQEEDVNNQDANPDDNRGSTITGAIIKRVRNNKALDLTGADAFDVILEHIQNMEHWAAFAEFNRDLNTLLSYKRFRNRMLNMASARFGSGKKLWTNFKRVCAIASGVYRPKVDFDSVDTNLVNVAKGVTRAKIAGRFYTALKQFLSYPAYLSEANPIELIKTTSTPIGWVNSWNWAIDNLPGFAERWLSRQAGDTRLKESDADWGLWKNKVIEIASRLGMTPNALVDAWTFSMGAKAIYETKFKFYKKLGYTEEQAKQRALRDASVSPNETQQSSANAYVSAMQLDRTAASVALTVFRNASMGYQRRLFQSFANLKHMATKGYKAQSLEYLTKQMERDGLDHATAEAAAKKVYNRALYKNIADVAIFGWVMQFAWNLGAYLPYLFMGDDDDDKKDMLTDAALHAIAGGIEGLTGGSVMSDTYNAIRSGDAKATYSNELLPLLSDIESLKRTFKKDVIEGANDLVNLIVQAGVGVNPQTITDWVVAGLDALNGDPRLANEYGLLVMRVMSAPQGQLDQLYIDELGMTAGDARKLNAEEFANRYARYKMGRESTFTGWAYSEQGHNDAVDRYVKNFGKKVKERLVGKDIATLDDAYERGDDYMKDIVGKAIKTRLEAADDSELPTIYKYTTNEVTKKTAGREMAKRISKNEDLDEYFDKQRDPVLRKAAASEIAKRLGTQDYAGKTPQAKWTQETKDAHERYQELRTAADVQEDCQVTLLKVSDEDKAELREIKKYLGQGGDDAAIMQEYREARAEILKNYK